MLRRTKIVATLGPATDAPGVLEDVIRRGADVVRLNFSHGIRADQVKRVEAVRAASERVGKHVAVLGDLQGPKIRIERFAEGRVVLNEGEPFALDPGIEAHEGTARGVGISYDELARDVRPGDELILGDGQVELVVLEVSGARVEARVTVGGEVSDHKGINRRGGGLSAKALTDKDREDVRTAAELEMDYLAVSFVRQAADVEEARTLAPRGGQQRRRRRQDRAQRGHSAAGRDMPGERRDHGGPRRPRRRDGLRAADRLAEEDPADRTHARPGDHHGDADDGVDDPQPGADAGGSLRRRERRARWQRRGDALRRDGGRQVSGARNRGDGGGDRGRRDLPAPHSPAARDRFEGMIETTDRAIARAVMFTANHMDVEAIVALTESGSTPLWMSRIRSDIPIFAFTRHERTRRRVALYRGVYPVPFGLAPDSSAELYRAIARELVARGYAKRGDRIILTMGELSGVAGGTNTMKILEVS